MKKIILIVVFSVSLGLGAGYFLFKASPVSGPEIHSSSLQPEPAGGEKKIAFYRDPMHPWYTSDKPGKAPDCGMDLVPVYEGTDETGKVRIDPVTVQNIGVSVQEVTLRDLSKVIRAAGSVDVDETLSYSVNCKISGWVEALYANYTGMVVKKGQRLLELYSPELVTAQAEYLQALRYKNRLSGSESPDAIRGAEQLVQSAMRRLLNYDISPEEIAALEKRGSPTKTLTIYSSVTGIVMEKAVFQGQNVMAGAELFRLADLSVVWIIAEIYQHDLSWIGLGQKAEIEVSYLPGKVFSGEVSYIYPELDADTKTAKVRIKLLNGPGLELKPGMFVSVRLKSPAVSNALAVPEQAVIRTGERSVAVVALGGGYFDPREIKLGVTADGYVQVLEGLHAGEKIVVSAQFLIDSESNLKAALGQMGGHAGMNMSKPMTQQSTAPEKVETGEHGMDKMQGGAADSMTPAGQEMKIDLKPPPAPAAHQTVKQLYTCVMHPEVVREKPGDCPKCGMKLVPKKP